MDPTAVKNAIEKLGHEPDRWLLVDASAQEVALIHHDAVVATWPVSTAAAGLDARQDGGGTPPGVHRIAERIGDHHDFGAVFVSREPTGEVWTGEADPRDLIIGRILTLDGLEDGVNRGPGVDSRERFIYLHGTNHTDRIGEPCSHGCVRLRPEDMLALFDRVEVGDPVVIA